ncbi:polyprenol phosphomannose-dependent alpha 1,6 mannosyltransferase MptB [Raineyella sp.]|uniref:polyprenol phosphomannose-dependent alpha 1,6 mannosyltransferase MptB n=1 Tax=Raineyella sp. TaxID=1911550 RepID=UPI002B20813B|nr:polyprenol phosphomannose-dependent alpha 1,6 mannosyltransferase MptB [Raineyella sp.]MEA5155707.1 polyprenol phosphomannose-dependent alpha 1,6 mannosyltransferase MptB [Raineyella sp.]
MAGEQLRDLGSLPDPRRTTLSDRDHGDRSAHVAYGDHSDHGTYDDQRAHRERLDRRDHTLRLRAADALAALAAEWYDPMVRQGLLGFVLIVLGSLSPAFIPDSSPLWSLPGSGMVRTPVGSTFASLVALTGAWFALDAWLRLRPSASGRHDFRAVLALWSAPFLVAPPIFSHDAYSYAAQGWLVSRGVDPYQVGPGALPGPFADAVSRVWLYTPAPYGPLSLQIQRILVDATGGLVPTVGSPLHAYLAAMAMRIPAVLGVVLIAACLPALLRHAGAVGPEADRGMWLAVANPLMIVHFVGGAHNDALMVGLMVLALWYAGGRSFVTAAILVGVATAAKQPAALAGLAVAVMFLPAEARRWAAWREILRRTGTTAAIALASFGAVSLLTGLGFGWLHAMTVPGSVPTIAPSSLVAQAVNGLVLQWGYYEWGGVITATVEGVFGVATVGFIGWIGARIALHRPIRFVSWGLLAAAIGGAALHGWYLLWGGLLLPVARPSRRLVRVAVWVSVGMVVYYATNLAFRNQAGWLAIASLVPYAVLMVRHDRAAWRAPIGAPDGLDPADHGPLLARQP